MRITVLLLTILSCVLPGIAEAEELRVMTFNIRYGSANDGEDAWPLRRDKTVAIIRETAPDLFGVQECLDFQAEYIADQLPEYAWEGRGRDTDGSGEMCAIFYRKDRLEVESIKHFWLSETPDEPGSMAWDTSLTRMVTRALLRDKTSGKTLHFFNTHFDHRGPRARIESARLIEKRVAEIDDGAPIIVTGDFNANGGDSQPWKALTLGNLRDCWDIAETKAGPANTSNGFRTPAPDAARRIDWILVGPGITVSKCATLDQKVDGRYPSDHFPVVAELALP